MSNERQVNFITFDETEKPRHQCGIFGLYYPGENVAQLTYFGLQGLQHRGQESAGIASLSESGQIEVRKKMGLVRDFSLSDLERSVRCLAACSRRVKRKGSGFSI